MARHDNLCKNIHLPVQSGSSKVLARMNRTYDRPWYLERIESIRRILPDCAITTDIIVGFCGETEEDHRETLSLMEMVRFDSAYMFAYSERPGTLAARKYPDDVPEEIKKRRLAEVMALQDQHSVERNQEEEGKVHRVLIEGKSKRSDQDWCGRNSRNKMVVFPGKDGEMTPDFIGSKDLSPGTFVDVTVHRSTKATLMGQVVEFDAVQA